MMLRIAAIALLFAESASGFSPPASMRIDYHHSGNRTTEMFALDQVVIEPLPWPGNLSQPIDETLRGKYLFEVVQPDSDEVLWSRSFSSIYGEWETTGEAREINRSFHESVRFPLPDDVFQLVIKKRKKDNSFAEVWRIEIDPDDVLVHHESAAYGDEVGSIHHSGDPANKVDLLLLGDGYTAEEQQAFIAKARELTDILLSTSPFLERRDDFNVWALAPPAAQSGITRPTAGEFRDSPLGTAYSAFRSERYVLTLDNKSFRRIASSAPYDFVEILFNSETYGGGGIYGLYSTAAAHSEWAPYLFIHEFGHHFAGLADEYYTSAVAYEAPADIVEPYEPNVTALLDPDNLKWRKHILPHTPLPTEWPKAEYERHTIQYQQTRAALRAKGAPESEINTLFHENQEFIESLFDQSGQADIVGAFEGGNYQSTGYYRPAQNCLMFTRTTAFCSVCAEAIEQVIDEYTLGDSL